jgi:sporadic carbohydrate cluster protein (TIGR04323 family)|tara:strand:+ start:1784 stop:2167 length:384 start_codon:yes stop_codon:yes gene_type:complete
MLGFRGYIFSRKIDSNFIPQRVQNLVIKDYCERNNLFFKLSATEYKMQNCYLMFNTLIQEIKKIEGIVFYSLFMLPETKKDRLKIYKKILFNKKQLHFSLEEIKLENKTDIKKIEDIYQIKSNTKKL